MGRKRKTPQPQKPPKPTRKKRGRGRPKKIVEEEKIDKTDALTPSSSNALALVPVTRRHDNAEHTRIIHAIHSPKEPEEVREPTAGFVVAAIDGLLYEGDQEGACPKCSNRLMWYWMPDAKEILSCVNPVCDYPFDETSELRVRTRVNGRKVIAGIPPDEDARAVANSMDDMNLRVNEPDIRCYIPPDTRPKKYGQEFVDAYLEHFMKTPKDQRKPEVADPGFIDQDSIRVTMDCLKALETAPIPD